MKPFNVDELLQVARSRTGLSDFGPPHFMEGLRIFVDCLNRQNELSEERREKAHERILRLLINRLWFAKDMSEHPEIADENVDSPIVIVSLPRTGSTKLHRMLGASDDFQTLQFWKTHMFARIPGMEDGGVARRIRETRDYEKWMYEVSPEILTGHPMFTDEPEEDQWLCECEFRQTTFAGMFNVPGYGEWLMQADQQPVHDYFLAQLKYLQWQFKPRPAKPWLLKSPDHLGNEKDLAKIFKKPRFIVTHRDPVKCVPSITTTALYMRKMYLENATSFDLGPVLAVLVAHMADEHVKWRDSHPDIQVLDLSYREINEDGMNAVRKVYDYFGMPLSTAAEKAMQEWEQENKQHKHGKNVYSIEAMGATETSLRLAFASYIQRYSQYIQPGRKQS